MLSYNSRPSRLSATFPHVFAFISGIYKLTYLQTKCIPCSIVCTSYNWHNRSPWFVPLNLHLYIEGIVLILPLNNKQCHGCEISLRFDQFSSSLSSSWNTSCKPLVGREYLYWCDIQIFHIHFCPEMFFKHTLLYKNWESSTFPYTV